MTKRISIRLNTDTFNKLNAVCTSKHISKSKFITQLIQKRSDLGVRYVLREGERHTFNMRIDKELLQTLDAYVKSYGFSRSKYLQLLIYNEVTKRAIYPRPSTQKFDLHYFFNLGLYKEITSFIGERYESLSDFDLVKYAYTLIRLGENTKASQVLDVLHSVVTSKHSKLYCEYLIAMARLARGISSPQETYRYASEALTLAKKLIDTSLIAKSYVQLGNAYNHKDDYLFATACFTHALTYSNPSVDSIIIVKAYLLLTYASFYYRNFILAKQYLEQAKEVFQATTDYFMETEIIYIELRYQYLQDVYDKKWEIRVADGLRLARKTGSQYHTIRFLSLAGAFSIRDHNRDSALTYLKRSGELEGRLFKYTHGKVGFAKAISTSLLTREHYTENVQLLSQYIEVNKQTGDEYSMYQYLLLASKYLYSPDTQTQRKAANELRSFSKQTPLKVVKEAALFTLQEKALFPIM